MVVRLLIVLTVLLKVVRLGLSEGGVVLCCREAKEDENEPEIIDAIVRTCNRFKKIGGHTRITEP